jgi:hypothetical protein
MLQRSDGDDRHSGVAGWFRATQKQLVTTLRARARLRRQKTSRARAQQLKYVTPEQLAYADALERWLRVGRYLLIGTFIVYLFGLLEPKVPLSEITALWSLPAWEYAIHVGVGTGWGWLKLAHHADYMNFIGIAFLASITIICYLRLLPIAVQKKNYLLGAILASEVVVLVLAASGLLAIGH